MPLELGRHDPRRRRGPGGTPGGRARPLSGLRAGPAANGRRDGNRAAPSTALRSAESRAIHRGREGRGQGRRRGLRSWAWPAGCPPAGVRERCPARRVRPRPAPSGTQRSAAGKFPPPGPARPRLVPLGASPPAFSPPSPTHETHAVGPPCPAAARPRADDGRCRSCTATGNGAGSGPGAGEWRGAEPPRTAPGVPRGPPPPRPRSRLPATALARGRANILASATARCRSFASGRHGGSAGIWKVPAAL